MSILRIIGLHMINRRVRTAFLGLALSLGVATVIAMVSLVSAMRLQLGNELDKFGPNIVIMPKYQGQTLASGGAGLPEVSADLKPLTAGDIETIGTIKDRESLNIISPKLVAQAELNGQPALLVGLLPEAEFNMKPWFTFRETLGAASGEELIKPAQALLQNNQVLLGSDTAKSFGLSCGSTVTLNAENFVVTGILNPTGGAEDRLVFANLSAVQELTGYEQAYSMIEVSGFCNFCPIEDMAGQITELLPNARVTALRQAALVRTETIDRFETFGYLFSAAALIMTVLSAVTTMLSTVNERTREIGTYRAIGFRKSRILALIIGEAVVISILAGLIGYAAGILAANVAGPSFAGITAQIPWDPKLILPAVLLSVLLALIAGAYPAVKAANLDPVRAVRHF